MISYHASPPPDVRPDHRHSQSPPPLPTHRQRRTPPRHNPPLPRPTKIPPPRLRRDARPRHIALTPTESIEKATQLIKGGFSFAIRTIFKGQVWQDGITPTASPTLKTPQTKSVTSPTIPPVKTTPTTPTSIPRTAGLSILSQPLPNLVAYAFLSFPQGTRV